VSYGSEDVLPTFLRSIGHAAAINPLVVIVDNKATADSPVATIAAEWGAEYLALPDNPGYGGALNAAVALLPASIEWVVLSNPDVVLGEASIDLLVAAASSDTAIASVGPRVLTQDGETYPSARAIPSLRTGIGHAMFANLWPTNPWTRSYRNESDETNTSRDAGWLSGSCLVVRRAVFDQIGGFDTDYFMYFEDVDLGYRLGRAGFRNVYVPSAVVTHAGAHSTSAESSRMIAAHHTSAQRFIRQKYSTFLLWPVRTLISAALSIRSRALSRRAGHH